MSERAVPTQYPADTMAYRMSREAIGLLEHILSLNVQGLEHLEPLMKKGPVVSALGNHESHIDGWLMCRILQRYSRRIVAPGASDYWETNKLKSTLARAGVPYIPLHRNGSIEEMVHDFACLQELVREGYTVFIATPGTRMHSQGHKDGAARLAVRTGTPLIPAILDGTREILPVGKFVPRPFGKRVDVLFGPPLWPNADLHEHKQTKDLMQRYEESLHSLNEQMTVVTNVRES